MSKGINSVVLDGRLGQDPELKRTNGGQSYAILSVATNTEAKKGADDKWEDITQWHRVIVWGEDADFLANNAHKGDRVYVAGSLANRSWEHEGQKRYITEVKAATIKYWPKDGKRPPRQEPPRNQGGFRGSQRPNDDIPF